MMTAEKISLTPVKEQVKSVSIVTAAVLLFFVSLNLLELNV